MSMSRRDVIERVAIGVLTAAVTAVAVLLWNWGWQRWELRGTVQLPGSFRGETWRLANLKQYAWLQDEWCYPGLGDFRTRFRIKAGLLEQRNLSDTPVHVDTGWVKTRVYISNHGVLRVTHEHSDLPAMFIGFSPDKTAEWFENERSLRDDGSIVSGEKFLVLSCRRCRISHDGLTYSCT